MLPNLYIKLIGAAIICALIGGGFWYVSSLRSDLAESRTRVTELEGKFQRSQDDLKQATADKAALDAKLAEADAARAKVQADLQVTLRKLRNQKPPVECKAAIDWAVDNKDDLKW